jgi:Glycosyl hydrolase catalytic core
MTRDPADAVRGARHTPGARPGSRRPGRLGMVVVLVAAALVGAGVSVRACSGGVRATAGLLHSSKPTSQPSGGPSLAQSVAPSTGSPVPAGSGPTGPPGTAGPAGPAGPAARSAKKGVSLWSSFDGSSRALGDVRASWFYNWSPQRGAVSAPGVEFVPMIWGKASVNAGTISTAKAQGRVLLGFNEPDLAGQSNLTVTQALDLWPQLMATGMRLGSPAPAFGADRADGWFDRFMSGVKARGYRVDFIALHWYGSDFGSAATNQLRRYLQATYDRYHLPIWLTEYALINFSGSPKYPTLEQQAQFVRLSTAMLQSLSYVERYAWFALPSSHPGDTGLYSDGSTPTTVGLAYRAAGG